jgi:hypothetical protein
VSVALLFTACETESAATRVEITPASAAIRQGQSVEFTAHRGYEYTWDLAHEEWGLLSTRTGNRTVYTSYYTPASNLTDVVQTLTVSSSVPGGTGTNDAPVQWTAEAFIRHL